MSLCIYIGSVWRSRREFLQRQCATNIYTLYIYMYIYICYMYICIYICVCIYMCVCIGACIYLYVCASLRFGLAIPTRVSAETVCF